MQLIDRVFSCGFVNSWVGVEKILSALETSKLVVIDNVSEYYFSQRYNSIITADDFPSVMLPFERVFLEAKLPNTCLAYQYYTEGGLLLVMQDSKAWKQRGHTYKDASLAVLDGTDVAYHLNGHCFLRPRGEEKVLLLGSFVTPITKEGRVVSSHEKKLVPFVTNMGSQSDPKKKSLV